MVKLRHLSALCLLLPSLVFASALPEKWRLDDIDLNRISSGSAYYAGLFRIYDAALYATDEHSIAFDGTPLRPLCLSLAYRVSIEREQLIEAAEQALKKQRGDLTALRQQVQIVHDHYRDVQSGDSYALCYQPIAGTHLFYNGELQVTLPGEDFARAYLGIWLGERPLSPTLRDALLPKERKIAPAAN